jgi:hypothetical protein
MKGSDFGGRRIFWSKLKLRKHCFLSVFKRREEILKQTQEIQSPHEQAQNALLIQGI